MPHEGSTITSLEKRTITKLLKLAEAHDVECEDSCEHEKDCPQHQCYDHRLELAAAVCVAAGLSLLDIGYLADQVIEQEVRSYEQRKPRKPKDVLDAKVINFP
jgi:hypothetical protein